ncbi:MAG: hypothetical protein NTW07_08135 [candidate division Zixibacteria bacterium]|nr:hypothetical protein [candidate division Zixibacteria bacterium]
MRRIVFALLLSQVVLAGVVFGQDLDYSISVSRVPSNGTGLQTVIGIPRQQAVCLSADGHLVTFNRDRYLYLTHDRGATWIDTLDILPEGYYHEHFAVWKDTVYVFSPNSSNNSSAKVKIISTNNGQLALVANVTLTIPNYSASGEGIIASGSFSGVGSNGMVMLLRSGSTRRAGHYAFSNNRGRTWSSFVDSIGGYHSGLERIGLASVGDSCMALIYDGSNLDIWHFRPSNSTWSLETGGHFISGSTQRAFSAAVVNDTIWASITNGNVSRVLVNKRRIGTGPVTQDTLWSGPAAYLSGPEYIGYTALQVIEQLNTVVCWYVHPDNGIAGSASSKLYLRIWYDGRWSDEQLISNVGGACNLTAPFVVPASHGSYAYVEFLNSNGMNLAAVNIGACRCTCPTLGNVNHSADCLVTISDIATLVDHLFISKVPLACPQEGNVNLSPDGLVSISDVSTLVDHLFISKRPLPPCSPGF